MLKYFLVGILVFSLWVNVLPQYVNAASDKKSTPTIVFVPLDTRPITNRQTAEVVEKLGYNVVVPPNKLLGSRHDLGHPDELWQWLRENVKHADAAVVSADTMLYGSLVGSRKHNYDYNVINKRVENFRKFHKENPKLPLYVFGSIMRTPRSGGSSSSMEPDYYRIYGADIFRFTALKDKEEVEGLTAREEKEISFLQKLIPEKSLKDWFDRRIKNYNANQNLLSMVESKEFNYLVLGRDDSAPYSQTHLESRRLSDAGKSLGEETFLTTSGTDEMGLLMLTRAVNDMRLETPSVYVQYNWGCGANTIPSYCDEKIAQSISSAIAVIGGELLYTPEGADLVLLVNTNPNGKTYEANTRNNDGRAREGSRYFADVVAEFVNKGYPVGIADIAFANGADNTLMIELGKRNLLYKLKAYAGWNTATNSSGFALSEGVLARFMTDNDINALLTARYLDDWGYQANIRTMVAAQMNWLGWDGYYSDLGDKKDFVTMHTAHFIDSFVNRELNLKNSFFDVAFPWDRMFEVDITPISTADNRIRIIDK